MNNNGKEEIIAPGGKINIGPLGVSYDRDGLVYTWVTIALGAIDNL